MADEYPAAVHRLTWCIVGVLEPYVMRAEDTMNIMLGEHLHHSNPVAILDGAVAEGKADYLA